MSAATEHPLVMGIINVTPDSFSGDGLLGQHDFVEAAVAQARQMVADGADMLDVGGESSRPGSAPVSTEEEINRVVPVIATIREALPAIPVAVDTVKAAVAEQALQAGASMVNDVSALAGDAAMAEVVARHKADIVLMHNRAMPDAVSGDSFDAPDYGDVVEDVAKDLSARIKHALAAGIARDKIVLDPGVGFGKTREQNLELIAHLYHFKTLGFRVLMGVSRKSFIGQTLDLSVDERLEGTAACVTACVLQGADIMRVHDVKFMARVVKMAAALRDA